MWDGRYETRASYRTPTPVRIESTLFDGFTTPRDGALRPDLSRPGIGVELKIADAQRYAA